MIVLISGMLSVPGARVGNGSEPGPGSGVFFLAARTAAPALAPGRPTADAPAANPPRANAPPRTARRDTYLGSGITRTLTLRAPANKGRTTVADARPDQAGSKEHGGSMATKFERVCPSCATDGASWRFHPADTEGCQ